MPASKGQCSNFRPNKGGATKRKAMQKEEIIKLFVALLKYFSIAPKDKRQPRRPLTFKIN